MVNKIKFSQNFGWIIVATLFQILLMISATPAQSYQLSQSGNQVKELSEKQGIEFEDILFSGLNMLVGFLSIKQIASVSALDTKVNDGVLQWQKNYETTRYAYAQYSTSSDWACCLETKSGAVCQQIASYDEESCLEENIVPTKCENVAACEIGCCIDKEEGLCTTKSPRSTCELGGGIWKQEEECLIEECQKGCCVLGSKVDFITERGCEKQSLGKWDKDFRDYGSEVACLALTEYIEEGACVFEDGSCKFLVGEECVVAEGEFYSGLLCSDSSLKTNCTKQSSVGCVEGKDEIYWLDSCGNRENIYSSDRLESWNNGKVLNKAESCGWGEGNIGSRTCGNCNYLFGSRCAKTKSASILDGDFICEDLTCVDTLKGTSEEGNHRDNGESWCVYDGYIGDGKDVVGSRHWRRICVDGEVKSEPCADYRGQVCVESYTDKVNGGGTVVQSSCVLNEAMNCFDYNSKGKGMNSVCSANKDCMVKAVEVSKGFKFEICVPRYPRGFDLTYETGRSTANQLCGLANQKCIVLYEKKLSGWKCMYNCECEEQTFTDQISDLCISLGDCGSYINIEGKGTENMYVENAPPVDGTKYYGYENPVAGQHAVPKDLRATMEKMTGEKKAYEKEEQMISKAVKYTGMISGGIGTLIMVAGWIIPASTSVSAMGFAGIITKTATLTYETTTLGTTTSAQAMGGVGVAEIPVSTTATFMGGVATFVGALGIGMIVSTILTMAFGLKGDAAMVMAGSGVVVGAVYAGFAVYAGGAWKACVAFPWLCIGGALLLLIIAITLKKMQIGDTKEVVVKFRCLPWQPPVGAEDCEKCDDDPMRPCSAYRCSSLGKACGIINEDEENPECIQKYTNDGKPAVINVTSVGLGLEVVYLKDGAKIRKSEGECIGAFEAASFVLSTSKEAVCRFDLGKTENIEAMNSYFAEENAFTLEHNGAYMMPSLQSMQIYNLSGDIKEKIANSDIYVRCMDIFGNENKEEYVIDFCVTDGLDKTPPVVTLTNPVNGVVKAEGVESLNITIYLNEPAECKFDSFDRGYNEMKESAECKTGVHEYVSYGWACELSLTSLINNQNKFYIRCIDQPWLIGTVNESQRNVNSNGLEYVIYSSSGKLGITSIFPFQGKVIQSGVVPTSLTLEVKTIGGVFGDGIAKCSYGLTETGTKIPMSSTFSDIHKQSFNRIEDGDLEFFIECIDDAGNKATRKTEFRIEVDGTPPGVVRAYREGSDIKFITTEGAECFYDMETCTFDINENTLAIGSGFDQVHSLPISTLNSYKIKCRDKWGNTNPACAIILKPGP